MSLEQNRHFARRIRLGMHLSFLENSYIHVVEMDRDGWYNQEMLDRVLPSTCDFLFIDGPVGWQESLGRGTRSNMRARQWMKLLLPESKGVIVDDGHRRSNLMLVEDLFEGTELRSFFFQYSPQQNQNNTLVLAVHKRYYQILISVLESLGIKYLLEYHIDDCSHE